MDTASLERLRQIARELRVLPETFRILPDDSDVLGEATDANEKFDCQSLAIAGGELLAKAIRRGAFAGAEYDELRVLLRHTKNRQPNAWKSPFFSLAVYHLVPHLQDAGRASWREICNTIADALEANIRRMEERSGGPPPPDGDGNPPAIKRPAEKAFQAWRLRDLLGISDQTELAKRMIENGVPATQRQVSKWLSQVEQYLAAGNVLPPLPTPDKAPQSIDPDVIVMGARQDGRTPRQRAKRDPDADSYAE